VAKSKKSNLIRRAIGYDDLEKSIKKLNKEVLKVKRNNQEFQVPADIGSTFVFQAEKSRGIIPDNHFMRLTTWFFSPLLGQPRSINVSRIRDFGKTPMVRMSLNTILNEITTISHKIRPKDPDTFKELPVAEQNKILEKVKQVETFFEHPNRNEESWNFVRRAWHRDLLELDSGCLNKVYSAGSFEQPEDFMRTDSDRTARNVADALKTKSYKFKAKQARDAYMNMGTGQVFINKETKETEFEIKKRILKQGDAEVEARKSGEMKMLEIYARDGGSLLKDVDSFGIVHGYYQYSFRQPLRIPEFFNKREIVYTSLYPESGSAYGRSALQDILDIVESFNYSIIYNKDFFEKQGIPSGAIVLEGASPDQLKKFKAYWQAEIQGKGHKLPITNVPLDFKRFIATNREMEFLESQKWYANLIASSLGTTPSELGLNLGKNRSTNESEERVHIKSAIKPLLKLEEFHINTEVIPEFFLPDEEITVEYVLDHVDLAEEARQRKNDESDLTNSVLTINEVRMSRGLEEVDWGDVPVGVANAERQAEAQERFAEQQQVNNERMQDRGERTAAGTPAQEEKKSFKNMVRRLQKTQEDVKPGEDMIDESDTYATFLERSYKVLEDRVIKSIDNTLKKNYTKSAEVFTKTFGEFISNVFNAVLTLAWRNRLERIVKNTYKNGIESAETEVDIDIGFELDDNAKVQWLTDQQLDGYRTQEGKQYVGIKGATRQLQQKIINDIHEGLTKKESIPELKERVHKVFDVNSSRELMIARTESDRIVNTGKYDGFIKSGLGGEVEWFAAIDDRTSPVCKALNGQKKKLNELFEYQGQMFKHPPSHPNCRSTLIFHPK
jgi:SPP1 gp7 family putative phage head morphogenesis protein